MLPPVPHESFQALLVGHQLVQCPNFAMSDPAIGNEEHFFGEIYKFLELNIQPGNITLNHCYDTGNTVFAG